MSEDEWSISALLRQVLRICLQCWIRGYQPSPKYIIYSWYIHDVFITCSAYIHHTVVIYSLIHHSSHIHVISIWYIHIYIYIYTYIFIIYIYVIILNKYKYINIYIHRISIPPPPLFQQMSRCPRDLWSRSGTLSLGRHVTRRGAHAAPGITW